MYDNVPYRNEALLQDTWNGDDGDLSKHATGEYSRFLVSLNFFKRLNTKITARIQLTPWHRKVAHATPSTPLEKTGESTVTNKISIPILEREEIIRKIKGVLESPRAEKIPVATL